MPFKPNYNHQRRERERLKAQKKQEKQQRRKEAADLRKQEADGTPTPQDDGGDDSSPAS